MEAKIEFMENRSILSPGVAEGARQAKRFQRFAVCNKDRRVQLMLGDRATMQKQVVVSALCPWCPNCTNGGDSLFGCVASVWQIIPI